LQNKKLELKFFQAIDPTFYFFKLKIFNFKSTLQYGNAVCMKNIGAAIFWKYR